MSAALELVLDAAQARALTDRIKVGVEAVWELIKQAYIERAWDVLGYSSWDDYCTREFGTTRLRLPREERAEVVASLRESGLSIRAITAATGLGYGTVHRELPTDPNGSVAPAAEDHPEPAPVTPSVPEQELPPLPDNYMSIPGAVTDSTPGRTDRVAEAIAHAKAAADTAEEPEPKPAPPAPKPITGVNGKQYQSTKPDAPTPLKRKPITDAFGSANFELRRAVERVVRLTEDDRLKKNKDQIAGANLSDLIRARDALTSVIQQLEG